MKKLLKAIAASAVALTLTAGACSLTACAPKDDPKVLRIGASVTPHAEILNDVVKPLLEEQGYTVKITEFQDYIQPNTAVENGDLDANYFQHNKYMNEFNETDGTHLKAVAQVHYEPFGVYVGGKFSGDKLADLPDGATVGIPNDGTNEARALNLLEKEGLITLKSGVTASLVTTNDIESNPKNLKITELEAAQIAISLPDLAAGVINGNYALQNNLKIEDAIATENADSENVKQYVNVIAVKDGNENKDKIKALIAAVLSDEVKAYVAEKYNGAVVTVF